jgi:hypothetical protein
VEGDGWIDRSQPSSSCELFLVVSSPLALRFVPLAWLRVSTTTTLLTSWPAYVRCVRACVREIPNPKSGDDGGRRMWLD